MQYLQVDFVEEFNNPTVSPVFTQLRQDVSKSIRSERKGDRVSVIQPGEYPSHPSGVGAPFCLLM